MKGKLTILIVLAALTFSGLKSYGQDPHFSQFYANPLYLNPAFAGTSICPRVMLNYRNQWPSISGNFVTYNVGFDMYVEAISGGVGLLCNMDRAGEGNLNRLDLAGMYSYRLELGKKFSLHFGVQASYLQKTIEWNNLTFGDMIDPQYGFVWNTSEIPPDGGTTKAIADFAVGVVGFSDNFFFGASAHHITTPNEGWVSVSKLPVRFSGQLGGTIGLTKRRSKHRQITDPTISPNFLFMKQAKFMEFDYGVYGSIYPFVLGAWYRHSLPDGSGNPSRDAVVFLAGFKQEMFKFGYSYDLTISQLTNASGGAHEFSFGMNFKCPEARHHLKKIVCPSF